MMVNVHEAKTNFSKLLDLAHAGQEIILAKSGKPYALLTSLPPGVTRRVPGRLPGKVTEDFFEPLPEEEIAAWERA
ncbi:type II toxin-antitoxin system Phd/YefM family antitoxin [Desulfonatronum thiodismutans]|uniref:type II toxin-antitoxin system Phd/YefM family antitoxin n=1 Tax=Desulfonatronum thiodismutans TaxID=159290 RepID=UPI0004ABED56|nr:type II toxin-antitoxin system prevent-host-death family antitoxin [Desulfonatronum thiodismutans]